MAPPSAHASAIVGRIDGTVALDLELTATATVTGNVRSLVWAGDLDGFSPVAGQDVMVSVPDGERSRWRRYSLRAVDPVAGLIELWVTDDGDGPGAAWARAARIGDRVEAVGPRGKIPVAPHATAHVFVVDASGLAAMCAMAESLPDGTALGAVLLDEPASPQVVTPRVDRGVEWRAVQLSREGTIAADVARHLDAAAALVRAAAIEPGAAAAYVFGELTLTRRAPEVLASCGIDPGAIFTKPYWRCDEANRDNGEPDKQPR